MYRGEHVVLHEPVAHDDRILEVAALERHERHEHVLAERDLPVIRARTVRDDLPLVHPVPAVHYRPLVQEGVLVRAHELLEPIREELTGLVFLDHYLIPGHAADGARRTRHDHLPAVARDLQLDTGAHHGRVRHEQRNGLPLHVRAHQRAVRVIMLQERDQRGSDTHHLLRARVNVLHLLRWNKHKAPAASARLHPLLQEVPLLVQRGVCLRDREMVLAIRRKILHPRHHARPHLDLLHVARDDPQRYLRRNDRVRRYRRLAVRSLHGLAQDVADELLRVVIHRQLRHYPAVRRLDEAVAVDARVRRELTDQTDVRAFRRLDGTDAPVVRVMHIPHVEACPLPR